jgi:hypothetical protein
MVQAIAALGGLLLVGVTLLWSRASEARANLRSVLGKYLDAVAYPVINGEPLIERLRNHYMEHLRSEDEVADEAPFAYEQRYGTHKDVGRGLALLSMLTYDTRGGGYDFVDLLSDDLQWLGFTEDEVYTLPADVYGLRTDPSKSLRLITELVSLGSNYVHALSDRVRGDDKAGGQLAEKIWDFSQDDDIEGNLEAIERFGRMSGVRARLALFLWSSAIVVGLFALLSTGSGATLWPTSLALALAVLSIQVTGMLLNDMLRM